MGVETSKQDGTDHSSPSRSVSKTSHSSGRSWRGLNLLPRWQSRALPVQLFSVVRHCERGDSLYAYVDGQRWSSTEDGRNWPLDPPLSDNGLKHAQEIGEHLARFAQEQESVVHVVISSPYYRCIQTATKICEQLGRGVRLLIDMSLGEVYGPSVMGQTEPGCPVRGMEQAERFCTFNGIAQPITLACGKWPTWPESLKDARRRFALRFLSYLQRSIIARRNFILVTHADCVGTVLSTMPTQKNQMVEKVEFGGFFTAKRRMPIERTLPKRASSHPTAPVASFSKVLPDASQDPTPGPKSLVDFADLAEAESLGPKVSVSEERRCSWVAGDITQPTAPVQKPQKLWDAWAVQVKDLTMRKRMGAKRFQKRMQELTKARSLRQPIDLLLGETIELLLGEMDENKSFGGDDPSHTDDLKPRTTATSGGGHSATSHPTCYSFSTYLFGASEIDEHRECPTVSDFGDHPHNLENSQSLHPECTRPPWSPRADGALCSPPNSPRLLRKPRAHSRTETGELFGKVMPERRSDTKSERRSDGKPERRSDPRKTGTTLEHVMERTNSQAEEEDSPACRADSGGERQNPAPKPLERATTKPGGSSTYDNMPRATCKFVEDVTHTKPEVSRLAVPDAAPPGRRALRCRTAEVPGTASPRLEWSPEKGRQAPELKPMDQSSLFLRRRCGVEPPNGANSCAVFRSSSASSTSSLQRQDSSEDTFSQGSVQDAHELVEKPNLTTRSSATTTEELPAAPARPPFFKPLEGSSLMERRRLSKGG